mgnify:CR=1 FL=1
MILDSHVEIVATQMNEIIGLLDVSTVEKQISNISMSFGKIILQFVIKIVDIFINYFIIFVSKQKIKYKRGECNKWFGLFLVS